MLDKLADSFETVAPPADFWSLRLVDETSEALAVRQGVLQPPFNQRRRGAMVTVIDAGGIGYAATSDLSPAGLAQAAARAMAWAQRTVGKGLVNVKDFPHAAHKAGYRTPVERPWESVGLADKIAWLMDACAALKIDARIVDWQSSLARTHSSVQLRTSTGGSIRQTFDYLSPGLVAVANEGSQTQRRTGGGEDAACQGGLEQLARLGFPDAASRIAEEALALLAAPECPTGSADLLLMPSQMMLQIHESIGHPLELDRILGDERNYAGTSFVTLDMFGRYQYGSALLNVTFDPTQAEELASYGYDDEGAKAERVHIIRNGILERPLGGAISQARANGLAGTANARACGWNRPPIDRMANLNVEPGTSRFEDLVQSIEHGVLMDTNRSWSIDDSRNKFQFGCELGRLIENGELKHIVRNPNYRGISATFWRNLAGVGDRSTFQVLGVKTCGKGEPNQVIHVGHAAPACVFRNVEIFGGT